VLYAFSNFWQSLSILIDYLYLQLQGFNTSAKPKDLGLCGVRAGDGSWLVPDVMPVVPVTGLEETCKFGGY